MPEKIQDGQEPGQDEEVQETEESGVETFDQDRAMATIRKMRQEAKELRAKAKKADELEALEAERQKASMSDLEKATKRAEAAEAKALKAEEQAKLTLVRARFAVVAARAGALFPDDVYLLADKSGVETDDDGNVTGVEEAVKALIDAKRIPVGRKPSPELDGGKGGGQGPKDVELTAEELATAKKMGLTPEQYSKAKGAMGL
jgi:hypothetical protein